VVLRVDQSPQFPLHCLESVVDYLCKGRMGTVVHAFLIGDQFVARRHSHVDPNAERIAFLMGMVRLLDRNVASVDVIAEFFQAGGLAQDELIDLVGFIDAAVGDVNG